MEEKNIIYNWYHHMMPEADRKKICQILDEHNYEGFIQMYKKYNSQGIKNGIFLEEFNSFCPIVYFPDTAIIIENEDVIDYIDILNKDNFNKITLWDCECG